MKIEKVLLWTKGLVREESHDLTMSELEELVKVWDVMFRTSPDGKVYIYLDEKGKRFSIR